MSAAVVTEYGTCGHKNVQKARSPSASWPWPPPAAASRRPARADGPTRSALMPCNTGVSTETLDRISQWPRPDILGCLRWRQLVAWCGVAAAVPGLLRAMSQWPQRSWRRTSAWRRRRRAEFCCRRLTTDAAQRATELARRPQPIRGESRILPLGSAKVTNDGARDHSMDHTDGTHHASALEAQPRAAIHLHPHWASKPGSHPDCLPAWQRAGRVEPNS